MSGDLYDNELLSEISLLADVVECASDADDTVMSTDLDRALGLHSATAVEQELTQPRSAD